MPEMLPPWLWSQVNHFASLLFGVMAILLLIMFCFIVVYVPAWEIHFISHYPDEQGFSRGRCQQRWTFFTSPPQKWLPEAATSTGLRDSTELLMTMNLYLFGVLAIPSFLKIAVALAQTMHLDSYAMEVQYVCRQVSAI